MKQLLVWALLSPLYVGRALAAEPQPPCLGAPFPALGSPGSLPSIAIYHGDTLPPDWRMASCLGWAPSPRAKVIVALAGQVHTSTGVEMLLSRIGAISALPAVKYWSTTSQEWRCLAVEAAAIASPDGIHRRADFTADELKSGATFYYWENDSRTGAVTMQMQVRERNNDGAIITTSNLSTVRFLFYPLFPPGTIQGAVVLRRTGPDEWGIYLLSRILEGSSFLAIGAAASYVNRAVAVYRQIACIPTDREPPARP